MNPRPEPFGCGRPCILTLHRNILSGVMSPDVNPVAATFLLPIIAIVEFWRYLIEWAVWLAKEWLT